MNADQNKTHGVLTMERLRQMLVYDQKTGEFTWLRRNRCGLHAGCHNDEGYMRICLDQKFYASHRLAWFYMHGEMPKGEIDHINGIRDDNRIENLRVSTRAMNTQNLRAARRNSSTGLLGVSFYKPAQLWRAQITAQGKHRSLGLFDTPEAAHQAYVAAKRQFHEGCTI